MSTLKVNAIRGTGASSDAISVNSTDGTCTAKITNNLSNRNLIINGAMNVAQRGTSSTGAGHQTLDRFQVNHYGVGSSPTQSQVDVSSGTTPYTLGFRKAYKIENGNQSQVDNDAFIRFKYQIEAQDIANSGWNYTSTSSYITLSFWVKSSVAQNFYGRMQSHDGTNKNYPFETGSLTANTWTKITKTIPGNSDLQFDNNNGDGLVLELSGWYGTDYTSGVSLNTWATYASGNRTPDQTSTWYTTNDATFEITGVQLEVGDVATDFEHRSYGDELLRCMRYYQILPRGGDGYSPIAMGYANTTSKMQAALNFPVDMRATPSVAYAGSNRCLHQATAATIVASDAVNGSKSSTLLRCNLAGGLFTVGQAIALTQNNDLDAGVTLSAEL